MKYIDIRQPIVEGLFYPDDNEELKDKISSLLLKNKCDRGSGNRLILPHGGWDYIGDYLALGFNSLPEKDFKRVIVISNVHREFVNNIIIPEAEYFLINGKKMKVDLDGIKTIKKVGKKVVQSNIPHMEENSIEVILPFVENLYPNAKLIPILLGKTVVSLVRNLSNVIEALEDENTLIIVSSNFSSYEKEAMAKKSGRLGIDLTCSGKMSEIVELTRTNKLGTCGAGAIASLILLGKYNKIKVLKEGLTPSTPLSGGKATYYGSLFFE